MVVNQLKVHPFQKVVVFSDVNLWCPYNEDEINTPPSALGSSTWDTDCGLNATAGGGNATRVGNGKAVQVDIRLIVG